MMEAGSSSSHHHNREMATSRGSPYLLVRMHGLRIGPVVCMDVYGLYGPKTSI